MSPHQVSSVEDFRLLAVSAVRQFLEQISCVPICIPALRGEMRFLPGMSFHLVPELFLQLTGETVFSFPEEKHTVGPGEICLVPRGIPHGELVRGREAPFANLVFFPSKPLRYHLALEMRTGVASGFVDDVLMGVSKSCAALFDEAVHLWLNGHASGEAGARGALAAALAALLAALEGSPASSNNEPLKVMHARQEIHLHLHDPSLTVATLATRLHCSADHLSRLFRQTTGVSLHSYLIEQRLTRALDFLQGSSLNVAEVSQASGFRDPAYFTRAFRRWAGVTPREVRRRDPEVALPQK